MILSSDLVTFSVDYSSKNEQSSKSNDYFCYLVSESDKWCHVVMVFRDILCKITCLSYSPEGVLQFMEIIIDFFNRVLVLMLCWNVLLMLSACEKTKMELVGRSWL